LNSDQAPIDTHGTGAVSHTREASKESSKDQVVATRRQDNAFDLSPLFRHSVGFDRLKNALEAAGEVE
jgi:hypothetical protein